MDRPPAGARPDPAFVMCEARTGSTLLRFLLGAHPDVACPSETNLPVLAHEMVNVWSLMTGHPAPGRLLPAELPELPDDVVRGLRASMDLMVSAHIERVGRTWFCDKSLGSAEHAKLLLQIYPGTKFVCLYRHPMDVIASALEACPWGLVGYGFDPYIAATPGNSVFALARFWLEHTAHIMAVEEDFPDQCLRVRYEDLVEDPDRVMSEVFRHLGIPPVPDIVARCFHADQDNLGAGDYKIWYTNKISGDSVGRGWKIPSNLITAPVLEGINELSGRLGYLPVHADAWGVGAPPPDVRWPAPGIGVPRPDSRRPAPDIRIRIPALAGATPAGAADGGRPEPGAGWPGDGEPALVATALRERIETSLSTGAGPAAGPGGGADDLFRLGVFSGRSHSERPALLAVDPRGGVAEIIDPLAAGGRQYLDEPWELIGSADTWQRILDGAVNLGVALRRNEVRYRAEVAADGRAETQPKAESTGAELPVDRIQIQRRIFMVSRLLGCAGGQPS